MSRTLSNEESSLRDVYYATQQNESAREEKLSNMKTELDVIAIQREALGEKMVNTYIDHIKALRIHRERRRQRRRQATVKFSTSPVNSKQLERNELALVNEITSHLQKSSSLSSHNPPNRTISPMEVPHVSTPTAHAAAHVTTNHLPSSSSSISSSTPSFSSSIRFSEPASHVSQASDSSTLRPDNHTSNGPEETKIALNEPQIKDEEEVTDFHPYTDDTLCARDREMFDQFFEWCLKGGAIFSNVILTELSPGNRGFIARELIMPSNTVLRIPREIMITRDICLASSIGKKLAQYEMETEELVISAYILQERENQYSKWQPYLRSLPEDFSEMPVFYTEEFINRWLKGSVAVAKIKEAQDLLKTEFLQLCRVELRWSYEEFAWASMAVLTRQFCVCIEGKETTAMVPLADLLNHKRPKDTIWDYLDRFNDPTHPKYVKTKENEKAVIQPPFDPNNPNNPSGGSIVEGGESERGVETEAEAEESGDEQNEGAFTVKSMVQLKPGLEVFDSYGCKCNSRLLVNYGFAVAYNENNEAMFKLTLDHSDPLYEDHLLLLGQHELDVTIGIEYSTAQVRRGFAWLRIALANSKDCASILAQAKGKPWNEDERSIRPLSRTNEIDVLRVFCVAARHALAGFDSTVAEDEALLDGGLEQLQDLHPSDRADLTSIRNCIIVRKGEKQVCEFYRDLITYAEPFFHVNTTKGFHRVFSREWRDRNTQNIYLKAVADYLYAVWMPLCAGKEYAGSASTDEENESTSEEEEEDDDDQEEDLIDWVNNPLLPEQEASQNQHNSSRTDPSQASRVSHDIDLTTGEHVQPVEIRQFKPSPTRSRRKVKGILTNSNRPNNYNRDYIYHDESFSVSSETEVTETDLAGQTKGSESLKPIEIRQFKPSPSRKVRFNDRHQGKSRPEHNYIYHDESFSVSSETETDLNSSVNSLSGHRHSSRGHHHHSHDRFSHHHSHEHREHDRHLLDISYEYDEDSYHSSDTSC